MSLDQGQDPIALALEAEALTPEQLEIRAADARVEARNAQRREQVKQNAFGSLTGPDPVAAAKKGRPWSLTHEMRGLAQEEVDAEDPNAFVLKGRVTRSRRLAMKALKKADEGDSQHMNLVFDRLDGKVSQPLSGDPNNPLMMLHVPITETDRAEAIAAIDDALAALISAATTSEAGCVIEGTCEVGALPGPTAKGPGEQG